MTQDSSNSSAIKIEKMPLSGLIPIPSSIEYSTDDIKLPPLLNKRRFSQIILTSPAADYYLKIRKQDRSELAKTSASASDASKHRLPFDSPAEPKILSTEKSKTDLKRHQKSLACETTFVWPRNDGKTIMNSSRNDSERSTSVPQTASGTSPACTLQTAARDCAEAASDASDRSSNKDAYESDENPVTSKQS